MSSCGRTGCGSRPHAAIAQGASFATGKLLDAGQHDRIDGTFDAVSRGGTAYRCGAGRPDGPKFNAERPIDLAPFTALLLRKDVAEAVGLLDESFESYLEDVDFGLRCAARGIRGVYVPAAAGYHAGSATLGRWHPETVRRLARNQVLLVAKHYPLDGPRSIWAVVVAQALWGLVALRHGAGAAWLRGKGEGLRRFRLVRRVTAARADLTPVLARSEREIYAIQAAAGFDLYWRLYFLLT